MSLTLAMNTARREPSSQRMGRRRPRVLTICQVRTSNPAASKSSCDCPSTIWRTRGKHVGRRPAAYPNADRSTLAESASRWSADLENAWASSSARMRTSPVDRSKE
ncbi:MAG: hypothetical protein IPQ09_25020 [Myxococcales bacterium]|nr:hypothetical protein [Myxococcales bacterium]